MRTALLLLAAVMCAAAQPKKLVNAHVDTRSASAGLDQAFRSLLTAQPQPAWIGYTVPASRGRQFGCDSYSRDGDFTVAGGTVYLEPPSEVLVLYRVDGNQLSKIRTIAPGCDIDAGGAPVHWLTDVRPAESVALLSGFVATPERSLDSVMNAIGMHADAAADTALEHFVAPDQPEQVREKAVFWLGVTRGRRGFEGLKKVLAADPSERVRRRAVSALQQMPNAEGVPLLIEVAKSSKDAEVRKQAMSSLGQSRDPRAVAFFEDVLKSK